MWIRSLAALAGMLAAAACATPAAPRSAPVVGQPKCAGPPAVVVLMRHAEKASEEGDPELSEAGRARAARVASLLAPSAPTHLFASDAKRTQATLAPLARVTGRPVTVRPARSTAALGAELRGLEPGALAVVAHHGNGVPVLARALGVELTGVRDGALAHDAYGRVFVVVLGCGDGPPRHFELDSDEPGAAGRAAPQVEAR